MRTLRGREGGGGGGKDVYRDSLLSVSAAKIEVDSMLATEQCNVL